MKTNIAINVSTLNGKEHKTSASGSDSVAITFGIHA